MVDYKLVLRRKSGEPELWEVCHLSGGGARPSTDDLIEIGKDDSQIVEGEYFVSGPKLLQLREAVPLDEAIDWLVNLHGSEGKEAGNGMKPYTVYRVRA